jgi:hypothetical protein
MEHDVVLTCADGSVRKFRIYGRTAPRAGEVVTLPIDGKLVKARIDKATGAEIIETALARRLVNTGPQVQPSADPGQVPAGIQGCRGSRPAPGRPKILAASVPLSEMYR